MSDIVIRPLNYKTDSKALKSFLDKRDSMRLDHTKVAIDDGDAAVFVAEEDGQAVGWAAVNACSGVEPRAGRACRRTFRE